MRTCAQTLTMLVLVALPAGPVGAGAALVGDVVFAGGEGPVEGVFLHLEGEPLEGRSYLPPAEPVCLDIGAGALIPGMVGVMAGQVLEIRSRDSKQHTVRAAPDRNRAFSVGIPVPGMTVSKTFTAAEEMIVLRCSDHPGEVARVAVMEHPLFAVTGLDGRFRIENAPPGRYLLEVWHPVLSLAEIAVVLSEGETKSLTVTLSGASEEE